MSWRVVAAVIAVLGLLAILVLGGVLAVHSARWFGPAL